MKITRKDPWSGKTNTMDINVTQAMLDDWKEGTLIQYAMPDLTPDEREFIKTGMTNESWDEALK